MVKRGLRKLSYSKIVVKSYADMLALNPSRDNYFISVVEGCTNELVSERNSTHFPLCFPDCGGRDNFQHCFFSDELAREIVDFVLDLYARPEEKVLYVNCMAGKSRSGAIATFAAYILETNLNRAGAQHWQLVMESFKNENPQIVPNMHILYKLLREYFNR